MIIIKLRNGVIVVLNSENYIVEFVILEETYYCIWYSDDEDLFWLSDNKILFFKSIEQITLYCERQGLCVEEEISVYDFNTLLDWLKGSHSQINCEYLLRMWNIISDFSHSINAKFSDSDDQLNQIYEKLFFGNNLPGINLTNQKYCPTFSQIEQQLLVELFKKGINIIEKEFQIKQLL